MQMLVFDSPCDYMKKAMHDPLPHSPAARFLLCPLFLVTFCLAMISSVSFWHDEIVSVLYTQTGSWSGWLHRLLNDTNSEAQMPLFLAWARVVELLRPEFISPEWMYRAGNLVWIWTAILTFQKLGARVSLPWLPAIWLLHPFVWFYANEFRPYAMQLAGGALLLLALLSRESATTPSTKSSAWALGLGSLLTAGSSMLGFFSLAAYALADLWMSWGMTHRFQCWARRWFLVGGCLSPLIVYDLWTFLRGSSAAKLWNVGPANLMFAAYEFLGLSGLGPPRNKIRETVFQSGLNLGEFMELGLFQWCLAIFAVVLVAVLIFIGGMKLIQPSLHHRSAIFCCLVVVGNWTFLFIAACFAAFPFWGRHLSPSFPAALLFAGICLGKLPTPGLRYSAGALIFMLMLSSANVRWSSAHQKDDLRSAYMEAAAKLTPNTTLWWAASRAGGTYYHDRNTTKTNSSFTFYALSPEEILHPPTFQPGDAVVLGRPSLHDSSFSLVRHLATSGFAVEKSLAGATVWRRSIAPE
jgi:hypothetical protein